MALADTLTGMECAFMLKIRTKIVCITLITNYIVIILLLASIIWLLLAVIDLQYALIKSINTQSICPDVKPGDIDPNSLSIEMPIENYSLLHYKTEPNTSSGWAIYKKKSA